MNYSQQTPVMEKKGSVLVSKAVTQYSYDYLAAMKLLQHTGVDELIASIDVTKDGPIYLAFPKTTFKARPSETVSSCRYDREEVRTAHISKHIETYLDDIVAQVRNRFHTTIYPSTVMEGFLLFHILKRLVYKTKISSYGFVNYPGALAQEIWNNYSIIGIKMDGLCEIISLQDHQLKVEVVKRFDTALLQAAGWKPEKGVSPSSILLSPSSLGNEIRQNSGKSQQIEEAAQRYSQLDWHSNDGC